MTRAPLPARLRRCALSALLLGTSLLGSAGCVSPRLVNERCQAPYAEMIARYEASHARHERVVVTPPASPPVALALEVVTSARGAAGPVLVLQPGILGDATTWRFFMGALAEDHDLIAISPPGTGDSDVPDPRCAGTDAYSPSWLAACTLGALEAWEQRRGTERDYVLVGHSLGGTVVLRALADPALRVRHARLLARVRGAVLLAPANIALEKPNRKLVDMAQLSDIKAGFGERLGLMQKQVREAVRENAVRPERDALRSEALRMEALLGRPTTRHAAQTMLKRFRPTIDGIHPRLDEVRRMVAEERAIDKPLLLLWGTEDKTLPISEADALRARLPHVEFFALEHLGHSLHQEGLFPVVERLRAFVAGSLARPTTP